jgi:superfamily II DNA/RNA helicase
MPQADIASGPVMIFCAAELRGNPAFYNTTITLLLLLLLQAIESATGQRTCIVYGALPAETRRQQARLFNDPQSGANILIASDAIGLGLNFNIQRVIFTTMQKYGKGGRSMVPVPVSLVKQIAGRAGRRNR